MSTALRRPPGGPFDRFVAWVLDPDGGVMYGDEQERLRYYESSTVVASIQGILVPWVLAAAAWIGGAPVAPYLLAITVVYVGPWLLGAVYVKRRRVRRLPARITGTWIATFLLAYLPYPLLTLGLALGFAQGHPNSFTHGLIGGLAGGSLAGVFVIVVGFVRARRNPVPELPDEDTE